MSVYSVLRTARPAVYTGTLAELLLFGTILGIQDLAIPSDVPGIIFRGDGINPIASLSPIGTVSQGVPTPLNTTAAATVAAVTNALKLGLITSTSAAAVTITLPTAVQLVAALGARRGTQLNFVVDNSAGANTVTVAIAAGVTVGTAVITGSDTLSVAAGKVGHFKIYFVSATAALLNRVL